MTGLAAIGATPLAALSGSTATGASAYNALVADPFAERRYLVELEPYDPATGSVLSLRYSTHGFNTKPSENPASTIYPSRVRQALRFTQSLARDTAGFAPRVPAAVGEIRLANADGGLDELCEYAWDGREVTVRMGGRDFAYVDFGIVYRGVTESIKCERDEVILRVRDSSFLLDGPIQTNVYGGTGGTDGTEAIAGRPKPLCFGRCLNVEAAVVDPANLLYQVHDGQIQAVEAVYDKGVALACATSPSAGEYEPDLSAGTITLGGSPAGRITADVRGSIVSAVFASSVSQIVKRVATTHGGLNALEDFDDESFDALASVQPEQSGLYIGQEPRNTLDVLDELMSGIGAYWFFDHASNRMKGNRIEVPTSEVRSTFLTSEIFSFAREDVATPSYRVRAAHQRNFTVQTGDDLAGSVSAARRDVLEHPELVVEATESSVQAVHLQAIDRPKARSNFQSAAAASVEANRLLTLWKTPRRIYRVDVKTRGLTLRMNDGVNVTYDRYDLTGGKDTRVVGISWDLQRNSVILELFA